MVKRFEDLTFTDDFMFCKVMQNPDLCKRLIEMILSDTIGKITYISIQHNINTYEQAKSIRFDVVNIHQILQQLTFSFPEQKFVLLTYPEITPILQTLCQEFKQCFVYA